MSNCILLLILVVVQPFSPSIQNERWILLAIHNGSKVITKNTMTRLQSNISDSDEKSTTIMGDGPHKGGPPQGGPPKGGPPQGGPPQGGPPGGGPPPQTKGQKLLEKVFDVGFQLLYLGDDSGIRDSSKNLRVLWTRALLHSLNKISDPIASELLPTKTKWVVGKVMANRIWKDTEAVSKLDWIIQRTDFIDKQLNDFLQASSNNNKNKPIQIVLLGSGYDTRSLRYFFNSYDNLHIYEIDIPDVIAQKSKMVERFIAQKESATTTSTVQFIPLDLNEVLTKNKNIVDVLKENSSFNDDDPTMIICEAVLFYLIPSAVVKLTEQLFSLHNVQRYCFTDNLSKVGVTPGPPMPISARDKCATWLEKNDKELLEHDSIWGGAIHFVSATNKN